MPEWSKVFTFEHCFGTPAIQDSRGPLVYAVRYSHLTMNLVN